MDERKIDFALVSSTRKARGEGKTERDRAKKGGQRTLRDNGNAGRGKRRGGKPPANFEPDSAFRKQDDAKPADNVKKAKKKAKRPTKRGKSRRRPKPNAQPRRKVPSRLNLPHIVIIGRLSPAARI